MSSMKKLTCMTDDRAHRLYNTPLLFRKQVIDSDVLNQFYVIMLPLPKNEDLKKIISDLLPENISCEIGSVPYGREAVMHYFYTNGHVSLKQTPVIKRNDMLFVMKPEMNDCHFTSDTNDKYQEWLKRENLR